MNSIERFSDDELRDQITVYEAILEDLRDSASVTLGDISCAEAELHVARRELEKRNKK